MTLFLPIAGGETTTFPSDPAVTFLGRLEARHHGVDGKVYALGKRRIRIRDFTYDGAGPDAFFWAGESIKSLLIHLVMKKARGYRIVGPR